MITVFGRLRPASRGWNRTGPSTVTSLVPGTSDKILNRLRCCFECGRTRRRTAHTPHTGAGARHRRFTMSMTSLVGTLKHVSTPSRKIVIRHTMSRPCRGRVASVS
eukprot:5385984-Prymnesium_polylepis.1